MILVLKEVQLQRFTTKDLELVRQWRNDPIIQAHMFYQEHITEEVQKNWFKNIDKTSNYYFLILFKEKAIGVSHVSNINWSTKTAEVGLYVHNENYWGTHIPALSSIILLKFAFATLKLKEVRAKVQAKNKHAIKYNEGLGFEADDRGLYIMDEKKYYSKTAPLLKKLSPSS